MISFEIDGMDELQDTLDALPDAVETGAAIGVVDGMDEVLADASRRAPRESGELASSMVQETTERRSDFTKVEGGPDRSAYHGIFVEFGTIHQAPQPFLRPAWDENKRLVLQRVAEGIEGEIRRVEP